MVKIPGECVPLFPYRFLIPRLIENVKIYWSELADLRGSRFGILPDEQPERNEHDPGIL